LSFLTRFHRLPDQRRTTAGDDAAGDDDVRDGAAGDGAAGDGAAGDPAAASRAGRRVAAWLATALACLLVLFALIAPNEIGRLTPGAFVRIPLEGLLGLALVLVLPARARRVVAVLVGVVLGLLAILKIVDMGFFEVLARPFDPVLDWTFFKPGVDFLTDSIGRVGAIGAVVAAVALAVAVLVLMTLSVLRLTRLVVRRGTAARGTVAVLSVAWAVCAVLGLQIVPGMPVAAVVYDRDRLLQVRAGLRNQSTFVAEAGVDAFRDTPGDRLLTALRGKDVVVSFVESYGRDAVEDPAMAPQVDAVLDDGTRRLNADGFASRSAFLTSPTAGGGSWLAHATLLSGLWIDNQQRYQDLVTGDRLTLNGAFRRANWQTVGVMPGVTQPWPEAAFFGLDRVYAAKDLGYRGPKFSWAPVPDQYTLSVFERAVHAARPRPPVLAEIPLVSSHAPWAPIPRLVGWNEVGDGSIYNGIAKAGQSPDAVWRDPARVRTEYARSIDYSLNALISYVEKYGDDDLVLVFLGDHQPVPIVTGADASHDVPITIVAHDPAVLDRISGWGWQDGLRPGPRAPVWRMDAFRDRFLTAFGSQAGPARSPAPQAR
jgi:hypothetical protein